MEFLQGVEASAPAQWMLGSTWGHPILLCMHALGMAGIVGIIWMLGIRIMGFAKGVLLSALERLFPIAWGAFLLNAGSGVGMFFLNGDAYVKNTAFLIKMALILGGGIAMWFLFRALAATNASGSEPEFRTKVIAVVAMLFWAGTIVAGRIIGYTLDFGFPQ